MTDRPIRAICFDLDGTLLDSVGDLAAALNQVLAERAFPTHPVDAYKQFVGDGVRLLVERAVPEAARDTDTVDEVLHAYRSAYAKAWNVHSRLYPTIDVLLSLLTQQTVKLAICSNKPHPFTVGCMDHYFKDWRFEVVLGQQDHIPRKPDPAPALQILRQLNCAPGECLFVGDSGVDMATGRAAGMQSIGVTWGYRDRDELRAHGAHHLIDQPLELLALCRIPGLS